MIKRVARGGFKDLKDNEMLDLSATVLGAMESNTNFTEPSPTLAEVQAAHDEYAARLHVAKRGSQLDNSLKRDAREVLEGLLKRLAFYVSTVANGSLSVVLSSGFRPNSLPKPTGAPGKPELVTVRSWRQSGQASLTFDKPAEALFCEYQYTSAKDMDGLPLWSDEIFDTPTGTGNIIAPLTPGEQYFIRVRARNKVGMSDWTTPEPYWAQ
ncbi:fibronectin type III domain-containing protein [Parapedobacter sp. 10938]|uniref:fibronectin type III domain-containing protein n=1 Tax=Parapedobacter flavus TaxID=3110225 RepID=UPI002DB5B1CE|nr:fibronectin type III domain-containing protein [Parapedobacter sp. 10938]MEC3878617.1 fibronectin type III domain-containing protein [Parapedobacter sp. 10938]